MTEDIDQDDRHRSPPSGRVRSMTKLSGKTATSGDDYNQHVNIDDLEKGPQDCPGEKHHKSEPPSGDPSSKIWGLYLSHAQKNARDHSKSWETNINGLLVLTGLFAAVLAAFLVVSYPLLQPNLAVTTNYLLTEISAQSSSNGTGSSQPSSPQFRLPNFALRVNALWFASLSLTTACALWGTLMLQWNRGYAKEPDPSFSTSERARIRAYFEQGTQTYALFATMDLLPGLLHFSFLMFYVGLIDFLFNINHIVAIIVLTLASITTLIYVILSVMSRFYSNWPYQTPLTSVLWFLKEAIPLPWIRLDGGKKAFHERWSTIRRGVRMAYESKAIERPWTTADTNALQWTLTSIDENSEFEVFLDGLPGIFRVPDKPLSKEIIDHFAKLVQPHADNLFATCRTGILSDAERSQRLEACLKATWCFPSTIRVHFLAILEQWDKPTSNPWGPLSAETWEAALDMTDSDKKPGALSDPVTELSTHCIQALMAGMWIKDTWKCDKTKAIAFLQRQLRVDTSVIQTLLTSSKDKNQLQLAVAANLLSKSLPFLSKLRPDNRDTDADDKLKDILDKICSGLSVGASDLPSEAQRLFTAYTTVTNVFEALNKARWVKGRAPLDFNGPWVT